MLIKFQSCGLRITRESKVRSKLKHFDLRKKGLPEKVVPLL